MCIKAIPGNPFIKRSKGFNTASKPHDLRHTPLYCLWPHPKNGGASPMRMCIFGKNQIENTQIMIPRIRLVLTDIDGVWTDGGLYYIQDVQPAKKFHTYDSFGVLALQMNGIEVGLLSGDDNPVMLSRAERLKIGLIRTGVRNKLAIADELRLERGLMWSEIAYIGDDVMDLNLLKAVGWSGTVPNAPQYVQEEVGFVTPVRGGEGAFRSFAEYLLDAFDLLDDTIAQIRKNS